MTISANLQLRADFDYGFTGEQITNVTRLTSGRLLAMACAPDVPSPVTVYASDTNGVTWSTLSTLSGAYLGNPGVLNNLPTNTAIIVVSDPTDGAQGSIKFFRSTNGGATWTLAQTMDGNRPFFDPQNYAFGAGTYQRGKLLMLGSLMQPSSITPLQLFSSTDGGVTWTASTFIYGGQTSYPVGTPLLTDGGFWYIGSGTEFQLDSTRLWSMTIKLSSDYGATWTKSDVIETHTETWDPNIFALCAFDDDNLVAVGTARINGEESYPPIWYSADSGISWTHVPASDVTDWCTDDALASVFTVKRLTRDCAVLGSDGLRNSSNVPIILTNDMGHTWDIVPTVSQGTITDGSMASGRMITATNGSVIVPIITSNIDGQHSQLWTLDISC